MNISPSTLFKLIEKSISDASKGYEYRVVGSINGFKYQVILKRDKDFKLQNISKIEIQIKDNESEKIHLSIKIKE